MYKRILVPLDGSDTAQRGLTEAMGLARQLGASLQLLHVVTDLQWLVDPSLVGQALDLREDMQRYGKHVLAQAAQACEEGGLVAQTRLREAGAARPGQAIVDEATKSACDLVVMGTHGRRGVSRLLMGSDASVVVANSPVPVLLVRPDSAAA